uniref:Uncharacterized protein n=1 Tax=Arundo donax TaxID=35708 RepID=A0A0A9EIZ6_ARUDO
MVKRKYLADDPSVGQSIFTFSFDLLTL